MSWQPIETAPKDRRILVACMKAANSCKHRQGKIEADFWHNRHQHGFDGFGKFNPASFPATHWMECPELPNSQNQSPPNSV